MLYIKNLQVEVDGKAILKGLDLEVNCGQIHAIMGPNGSGKSTLSKVIAGHPDYQVTEGSIKYLVGAKKIDLLEMAPEERSQEGVFMAWQYPVEIPGVNTADFLRSAYNAKMKAQKQSLLDPMDFDKYLRSKLKFLDMDDKFIDRAVNVNFSGGEKKRNEILQMAVLEPKLAFLDETDSGLDIDSLKIVADGVNKLKNKDNSIVLITHYQRLLNYIKPDFVHILIDGQIVKSGDFSLAKEVEDRGYDWLK